MNKNLEVAPSKPQQSDKEYARLAKIWDESIKAYPFRMEVMYPNIIEGLQIQNLNEQALDLACGTGHLTNLIGKKVKVVGVDRSIQMIGEACRLYPNIDFVQADIGRLPMEDSSIDAISASCAYHYAKSYQELENMVRESSRVLKPGGRISGVQTNPDRPVIDWLQGSIRSAKWLDEPYEQSSRISIGVHDPETGKRIDAFTTYYYSTEDYKNACDSAGLEFEWKKYRPSEEFMQRSNVQEIIDSVQVRLFSILKK